MPVDPALVSAIAEVCATHTACLNYLKTTGMDFDTRDVVVMTELVLQRTQFQGLYEEEQGLDDRA